MPLSDTHTATNKLDCRTSMQRLTRLGERRAVPPQHSWASCFHFIRSRACSTATGLYGEPRPLPPGDWLQQQQQLGDDGDGRKQRPQCYAIDSETSSNDDQCMERRHRHNTSQLMTVVHALHSRKRTAAVSCLSVRLSVPYFSIAVRA